MRVLDDFELGRQHMFLHIRMKGAYHADFPLLLAGLCHPANQVARKVARRAITKWDDLSEAHRSSAHAVTRRFLGDAFAVSHRAALEQFATTARPLSDFPRMEADVYRVSLIRVDEHGAETPHALMKKDVI